MILTATINDVKRRILFDNPQAVVAVKGDYEVNGIAFAFPAIYEDDFDLSTAVKTVYYKATDGIIYNHVVTATDTDTGYPLWVFKDEINKGAFGDVEFALVCDKVEGGNIVKRWVSMITAFRVQKSIEIDESEQEENEQTYSERLADLMTQMANMQATVSGLASGAPTPVSLASAMTDTSKLYVYTGSESGYTAGHWYYYNGSAWADGGLYGGISVDTTLTVSGAAADAKKTGDEIATVKEDLSAIDGKVASVEDTANGLDARVTANAELSKSNEQKVYKFRTDEGANTGTGSAGASSSINWGIQLNIDENIEKCYSITFTPSFPSTITGEYTATRWKKASGTPAGGDVLTKIAEITKSVGESVTFEKVGTNEFISLNKSCYRSSGGSSAVGVPYVKMGYIDPSTGVFTSFSGVLSGTFSVTFYKAIKDDSMPLYGKKIALIGDSITEHNGRANTNYGMWLEQWTGCDVQNLGVDSAGFSTVNKYKDRIASIKAGTEIIGVAASLNDLINPVGEASDGVEWRTVCGYANEFFDLLLASFPSVPIVCYSEGPWESWRPGVGKSDNYMGQMKQICLNKGIAWDDGLYRGCALRPWIQANREALYKGESGSYVDVVDNKNPNSEGQKYIAIYLKGLFEKYVR